MLYSNINEVIVSESTEQILQEMHFSKADMQNPETVKKIIDKEFGKGLDSILTAYSLVGFAADIAAGIIVHKKLKSGGFTTSIVLLIPFLVIWAKIYDAINKYQLNAKDNNMKKLEANTKKLKEKIQTIINQNSNDKNITKLKQMIAGCDKTLAAIEAYWKKCADQRFMKEVDAAKNSLINFKNWYSNPYILADSPDDSSDFGNMKVIMDLYKITDVKVINQIKKSTKNKESLKEFANENFEYKSNDNISAYRKYVEEYPNDYPADIEVYYNELIQVTGAKSIDDKICFITLRQHDEDYYALIYVPVSNKLINIDYDNYAGKWSVENASSIEDEFDERANGFNSADISDDAFIEADKELGYYKLSPAPEGTEIKSFVENTMNNNEIIYMTESEAKALYEALDNIEIVKESNVLDKLGIKVDMKEFLANPDKYVEIMKHKVDTAGESALPGLISLLSMVVTAIIANNISDHKLNTPVKISGAIAIISSIIFVLQDSKKIKIDPIASQKKIAERTYKALQKESDKLSKAIAKTKDAENKKNLTEIKNKIDEAIKKTNTSIDTDKYYKSKNTDEKNVKFSKDILKKYMNLNGKINTDISDAGYFYYMDIKQSTVDKFAKSAEDNSSFYPAYMEDNNYGEDIKDMLELLKNNKVVIIYENGGGDDIIYLDKIKKFFYFEHEDIPQMKANEGLSLDEFKNYGKELLMKDPSFIEADKELGYYKLSEKPKDLQESTEESFIEFISKL